MPRGFKSALSMSVCLGLLMPIAAQAQEVKLKFLTAWDTRYKAYDLVARGFQSNVAKASSGQIKITTSGPEVVKPKQQYEPTSRGVFDLNWNTAAYHIGTTSVVFPFYGMPPVPAKWRSSGVWDLADKDYARHNQKLVAILGAGTTCNQFQLMLKRPYDNKNDLKGLKIRANAFYKDLVEPLGGSMVNLNGGDIYAGLQKGVVDGAAWPVLGAVNFKWYEVAKYMLRPRFGCTNTTLAMNLDRFKKLTRAQRGIILEEGRKLELDILPKSDKLNEAEVADLKRLGVKETWIDKDRFAKIVKARNKGIWDLAAKVNKRSAPHVMEMRGVARKHGLAE